MQTPHEPIFNQKVLIVSDPREHKNLAGLQEYQKTIEALKKWLPESEALPAGIEAWKGDSYGQRVQNWEQTEVPEWLK